MISLFLFIFIFIFFFIFYFLFLLFFLGFESNPPSKVYEATTSLYIVNIPKDKFIIIYYIIFFLLVDIDECERGTDVCVNAECNNTVGSYTCRPCFPGFNVGDATTCSKSSCFILGGREIMLSCNINDHIVTPHMHSKYVMSIILPLIAYLKCSKY